MNNPITFRRLRHVRPIAGFITSGLLLAGTAHAAEITRTPWQMHIAQKIQTANSAYTGKRHGDPEVYTLAKIPKQSDPEWQWDNDISPIFPFYGKAEETKDGITKIVPVKLIEEGNGPKAGRSRIGMDDCFKAFDYSYFQTIITVPEGTLHEKDVGDIKATIFKITIEGMDDGSRISIFNGADQKEVTIAEDDRYVKLGEKEETHNLAKYLAVGENRVVITQVDDCAVNNTFRKADIVIDGHVIAQPPSGDFAPTSAGDVHVTTADGVRYDYQGVGDFILGATDDKSFVVQSRQSPLPSNPKVSINSAAAIRLGADVIEFYRDGNELLVNSIPIDITATIRDEDSPIVRGLASGSQITVTKIGTKMIRIEADLYGPGHPALVSKPKQTARLEFNLDAQDVSVLIRHNSREPSTLGFYGVRDGDPKNDIRARDGETLVLPAKQTEIDRIVGSWRLQDGESLFKAHPTAPTRDTLTASPQVLAEVAIPMKTSAAAVCLAKGITDASILRDCTYDVVATNDARYADTAAGLQATVDASQTPAAAIMATGVNVKDEVGQQVLEAAQQAVTSNTLILTLGPMVRGQRYNMRGHYVIFQSDGNLCVYRQAEPKDVFVWCINDKERQYATTTSITLDDDGALVARNEANQLIYSLPTASTQKPTKLSITEEGVLQILDKTTNAVVWASK